MSKAQYTLLVGFIGFYALLFASLLVRACAGYFRKRRLGAQKLAKVSDAFARAQPERAWTRSVWRGKLIQEVQRMEQAAQPPRAHTVKALY
jgi:hypothetical protein